MMDCIVSAGGVPRQDDLLFEYTQGKPKSLLDLAGKPMVQWVIDALTATEQVERIILVGLGENDNIRSPKLTTYVPDQGSLFGNAFAGIEAAVKLNPDARQVLMCSSDVPLIQPAMIADFLAQCADESMQVYYGVVARQLMESRFPDSRRSYIHFTDGDFAGADVFVVDPQVAYSNRQLWDELLNSRKNVLKQARLVGLGTLLRLVLHRLSLAGAERQAARSLHVRGRAVIVDHAELGMDVDKPFQLDICRRELV